MPIHFHDQGYTHFCPWDYMIPSTEEVYFPQSLNYQKRVSLNIKHPRHCSKPNLTGPTLPTKVKNTCPE